MTFFITRPPFFTTVPVPSTKRTPIRLSRQAPACTRRGPEALAATTPPMVDTPLRPSSARHVRHLEGQLLPLGRQRRLHLGQRRARPARRSSAPPVRKAKCPTARPSPAQSPAADRPKPRVPPPRTCNGPFACRSASASSLSFPGRIPALIHLLFTNIPRGSGGVKPPAAAAGRYAAFASTRP